MNTNLEIIIAIIGGIFAIIASIISTFTTSLNPNKKKEVEVLQLQLDNLFTPLIKYLYLSGLSTIDDDFIKNLLFDNMPLVPQDLWDLYFIDFITNQEKDYDKFRVITFSYYELTRRKLKYPYDNNKIVPSKLLRYRIMNISQMVLRYVSIVVTISYIISISISLDKLQEFLKPIIYFVFISSTTLVLVYLISIISMKLKNTYNIRNNITKK